jgi:hypothetical protein
MFFDEPLLTKLYKCYFASCCLSYLTESKSNKRDLIRVYVTRACIRMLVR